MLVKLATAPVFAHPRAGQVHALLRLTSAPPGGHWQLLGKDEGVRGSCGKDRGIETREWCKDVEPMTENTTSNFESDFIES